MNINIINNMNINHDYLLFLINQINYFEIINN